MANPITGLNCYKKKRFIVNLLLTTMNFLRGTFEVLFLKELRGEVDKARTATGFLWRRVQDSNLRTFRRPQYIRLVFRTAISVQ